MAFSLQTGLKQSHKLAMTQSLKQAIELLQLSTLELYEKVSNELLENPILEEEQQSSRQLLLDNPDNITNVTRNLSGDESAFTREEERRSNLEDASDAGLPGEEDEDRKRNYLENITASRESLKEHLLWQARLTARDDKELTIYQTIITSLNEDGFLETDPAELRQEHVPTDTFARALETVRLFDPVGCAVGCVSESLLVQCRYFHPDDTTLQRIVSDCFEHFKKLDYEKISRTLNCSTAEVLEKSKIIQGLDPFPGRQYSSKTIRYIVPDIDVKFFDGEIIINLNDDWVPGLRINKYYISLLKKKNIEKNLREYIQDRMQAARYLIKNIANRRNTILRVVGSIMKHQRDFLERGPGHLKPLTHSEVAKEVNQHESTVSRVTSNKYVQTPWGVFDLKYFFVSRLKCAGDESDTSSDEAINLIKDIIERENAMHPYSDSEIVRILGKSGMRIARRTVAKYRGGLCIPPSNKRRKINIIKTEERT